MIVNKPDSADLAAPRNEAAWTGHLQKLLRSCDLSAEEIGAIIEAVFAEKCGEAMAAALLVALRMKGETAQELAAAAGVLRDHMVSWNPGRDDVLDTCGTGGDGKGTFNISTAAAIVAAGAGAAVVKHGNRSVSSKTGSADVLEELGVRVEGDPASARRCLESAGLAFCYAPNFHPVMGRVAQLRRTLGVATIFNCLGPLANPAQAPYQLLGVGRKDQQAPMAGALQILGVQNAFVVCAEDGLDEVSLSSATHVVHVGKRSMEKLVWTANDFGLPPCQLDDLRVESARRSAAVIHGVVKGEEGPAANITLANAAAALLAAQRVSSLAEGVALAREAIRSGRAAGVLTQLASVTE